MSLTVSQCIDHFKTIVTERTLYSQDVPDDVAREHEGIAFSIIGHLSAMLFGYDAKVFRQLDPKRFIEHISLMRADVYEQLRAAGIKYRFYVGGNCRIYAELLDDHSETSASIPISETFPESIYDMVFNMNWRVTENLH